MTEAPVEFADVSYAWGPRDQDRLLRGVSLTLAPGTTTALLGRSGSGKTTLMRMVNGMVMPTTGSVAVAGRSTSQWDPLALRRSIGYVIQESGLFPHWTIARNVGLALELTGKASAQRVSQVLKMAGLDFSLADRYPWQLSGGQRQRVGLARALAADPGVLLMDEPFGALDPITRAEMQTMLKNLLGSVRKTVLLVTHDLDEALYLADRVVFLDHGAVVADRAAGSVFESSQQYVREYIAAVHPRLRGGFDIQSRGRS